MIRLRLDMVWIAVGVIAVALALLPFGSGSVSAQGPEDSGTVTYERLSEAEFAEYEAGASDEVDDESSQMAWCNYETKGDYPHLSSTGFAASAHGWWVDKSPGECPEEAVVTVTLQAWMCTYFGTDGKSCSWNTLGSPVKKRIRAGGGAGRRTTARHDCASSRTVSYRSIIDVNLVGIWDGPRKLYMHKNVDCFPAAS